MTGKTSRQQSPASECGSLPSTLLFRISSTLQAQFSSVDCRQRTTQRLRVFKKQCWKSNIQGLLDEDVSQTLEPPAAELAKSKHPANWISNAPGAPPKKRESAAMAATRKSTGRNSSTFRYDAETYSPPPRENWGKDAVSIMVDVQRQYILS